MEFLINIFNTTLYQPLFNALILLYQYVGDLGIAIIVLTAFIRFLLYPLNSQAIKSQKALQNVQPKIKEIQEKYKNEKEKQVKATMEFYKKEKINPFSGCLPMLIQLPILIALFQIFLRGFGTEQMVHLYGFISAPDEVIPFFLGIIDLSVSNIILAVFVGIAQFIQTKMISPDRIYTQKNQTQKTKKQEIPNFSGMFQKQMLYFFPIITILILLELPSAVGLYWLATTLFSIGQQYFILKPKTKNLPETGQGINV